MHYCSLECQEEHWVKVHNRYCSSLASSVVPTYHHKEEECNQCLAVAAQGGPEAVSDQQSPVYPCILKSLDGTTKSLLSHHPFPLDCDPEDRIERLVILIKKLLLKMALSNHKVMQDCGREVVQMLTFMDYNRLMIWMLRKTRPCPEAAICKRSLNLCDELWTLESSHLLVLKGYSCHIVHCPRIICHNILTILTKFNIHNILRWKAATCLKG